MSEEAPQLKRDSTMVVTAREGEAFLEGCGKVDEDAKTRGQQKEIDAISEEVSPSKLKRATTMEVTASEGTDLLDGEELGKTRSETAQVKDENEENGADENGHTEKDEEKPSMKRDGTMQVTAKEGEQFLEEQGHKTDARTRGEAAAETENGQENKEQNEQETEDDEQKSSLKRTHTMDETLKEGEEFLKRQKTEDDTNADKAKEKTDTETEDKPEDKAEDKEECAEQETKEMAEEITA